MDTRAMADEIRSMAGGEFHDANDVHDTLAGMHEIVDAVHESFTHWANLLPEMGTHPLYAEVVQEVAGMLSGISDKLQEVTAGGVMRGPGS